MTQEERTQAAAGREWLPPAAAAYFAIVSASACVLAAALLVRIGPDEPWRDFVILGALTAAAQTLVVMVNVTNSAYSVSIAFMLAAALILPPELAILIPLAQFVPDWLKARREWTIQSFNITSSVLVILAAGTLFRELSDALPGGPELRYALAASAAGIVFVVLNHLVVDQMIHLARGRAYRELGTLSPPEYLADLVLAGLGVAIAWLWHENPALIPFALTPLLLVQRSLSVPALEAEARVDPKTGLFNARHFNKVFEDELARAGRHHRPLALLMIDLDLLREINNEYGHLAGDAVIRGIAEVFGTHLRHYDVPSRFGGEEYSVLLPETSVEQALEIAERIRATVATHPFIVETVAEPIRATVSIGIACFPGDATEQTELVHQADLAVYRAKLQGRNRVVMASSEFELMTTETVVQPLLPEDGEYHEPLPRAPHQQPQRERRSSRRQPLPRPRVISRRLGAIVATVTAAGLAAGIAGLLLGQSTDWQGIAVIAAIAGGAQALAIEVGEGSVSVSAVALIAAAALFGPRALLPCAVAVAVVEWAARRSSVVQTCFNLGTLALAGLAGLGAFAAGDQVLGRSLATTIVVAVAASIAFFVVNTALVVIVVAEQSGGGWRRLWRERFGWMFTHQVVYGGFAAAIVLGYRAVGIYALVVFALPLVLTRQTQSTYFEQMQRNATQLRDAAQTIREQNVSLELANRLLRERSAAAMETLTATVDARDASTQGHSRRVQEIALAIGKELGLSQAELELLGHAALFHDIGKLAVPDAVLLKPGRLDVDEWQLMQGHVEDGARIIERLGFLADAVPAIRHHHENYDGSGYPDGLAGEDIPLGARIVHIADAVESMLTSRLYREARPVEAVLEELHRGSGTQFCPRCVAAAETVLADGRPDAVAALSLADSR